MQENENSAIQVESPAPEKDLFSKDLSQAEYEAIREGKKIPASSAKPQDEKQEASGTSNDSDEAEKLEADSDIEDSSNDEDEDSKEKPAKELLTKNAEKRINKLTKQREDARREKEREREEKEYWRAQALKAKNPAGDNADETKAASTETKSDGKPDINDYATHAEYIEAVTDWKIEQKEKQALQKTKENEAKTYAQKQLETFKDKVKEFSTKHTDFNDVLADVDDVQLSVGLHEVILSSELGPAVIYELAKNRSEYERINALSPLAQAREVGKIEARLSKSSESEETEKPTIKQTKAPPPIKPVGSKGTGAKKSIFDPNLSQREYEQLRAEQERQRY